MSELNTIDHIAIPVDNISTAVEWYVTNFRCEVKYRDETWALLRFANISLALVIPSQHPAHIGFVSQTAEKFGALKTHRDGTRSCYVNDPAGNSIEMLAADSMPRN